MARRVTLTYVVTVGDGDDDDCTQDAESALFQALDVDDFSEIERTVTLCPTADEWRAMYPDEDGPAQPQRQEP